MGYWEPHTSSVDFCERNYEHSEFVVEWHNSWSSFVGISVFGLIGLIWGNPTKEMRHTLGYLILTLIGLGSVGLHGSLHWIFQSSDELPMIYLVAVANYMCVEVDSKVGEPKYPQLPTFLNILMVINTFIYYTFQHIYAVFIATYAVSSILNTFLLVYVVYWKNTGGKMGKKIFKGTIIGYLIIAFPIWLVDMHCCNWVLTNVADNMHGLTLHVVWHLCAGYGAYCVLVTLEYCRMIALKIPCTCDFWLGFIPITRRLLPKDEN